MFQAPSIITFQKKTLIGQSLEMSLANNKTYELFSGFMPRKKEVQDKVGTDIFEIMIYNESYFASFNYSNTFEKWATIEVSNNNSVPNGMKTIDLETGLYAVFNYKGLAKDFGGLMTYIFSTWMPKSDYTLDNRPHFNVLGKKYKHNDPDSEEEVWIPIKLK